MNTDRESRKAIAKKRLDKKHVDRSLLLRTHKEISQLSERNIDSEARELAVEQRLQQKHIQENMLSRAEAEINQLEK